MLLELKDRAFRLWIECFWSAWSALHVQEYHAFGKLNILFDNDLKPDEGAKETLWQLAQTGLDVRLAWSPTMFNESFKDREAETVTDKEWQEISATLVRSGRFERSRHK